MSVSKKQIFSHPRSTDKWMVLKNQSPGTNCLSVIQALLLCGLVCQVAAEDPPLMLKDVTDAGCRISAISTGGDFQTEGDIFVDGLTGVHSDRTYSDPMMVRRIGFYTYTTVVGGSRTIPRYEVGVPITKEEYLALTRQ
jgi:hypothetical protein